MVVGDGSVLYALNAITDTRGPIIIGIHGLGGHADELRCFRDYAELHGLSLLAFDLRGFGHWQKNRGDVENLSMWLADIADVMSAVRQSHPMRPVFLMGESLGANLAFWYCYEHRDTPALLPDGLIGLNLVTKPMRRVRLRNIVEGTIGYLFYPQWRIDVSMAPDKVSDDPEVLRTIEADSLRANRVSFRLLLQAKHIIEHTSEYLAQISTPLLVLQGAQDDLSQAEDVRDMVAEKGNRTVHILDACKHSMLRDRCRCRVCAIIQDWCEGQGEGEGN